MRYEIIVLPKVEKALLTFPQSLQDRVRAAIAALADAPRPHGAQKLAGWRDGYRIRVGDYRVIYEIQDDRLIVLVIKVAHRRDVYRS